MDKFENLNDVQYTGHCMPRVSKRKVSKKLAVELENQFVDLISLLKSPKYIRSFFQQFLTKEEKLMVIKRLMLHILPRTQCPDRKVVGAGFT